MKAVLVVDIKADELPKDAHASVYLYGKYSEEQEDDFLANMKNVPLKPMPRKRNSPAYLSEDEIWRNFGWNACLEEIEK